MELGDLQHRDIFTYPKNTRQGLDKFGAVIYKFLRKLKTEECVYGCYFTYYFYPPKFDPHIKIAIRYKKVKKLLQINSLLDKICDENKEIIANAGNFKPTRGLHIGLPHSIVVDYIGCYSFEWILKNERKLVNPDLDLKILAEHFNNNKNQIDKILIEGDIYRNSKKIEIKDKELEIIRGRFVHYICNIFKIPLEVEEMLEQMLSQYGWEINIFNRAR